MARPVKERRIDVANSNKTVLIGDYFERFVTDQVASGRFNSSSEVLRAGLRMLEEHELHLREKKSVVHLKEVDAKLGLSVSPQEAAEVTNSVSDAMRALATAVSDTPVETSKQPVIPATKGLLRSHIAAE